MLLLSGCASSPPESAGGSSAPAAATGDVDQIAATALALWGTDASGNGSQALSQIRNAANAAPERADIQWLNLRLCI